MVRWIGMRLLERNMAELRRGNAAPTLRMDADDVRLHFPGQNRWAGDFVGKPAVSEWLAGFTQLGLQIYPDEVVLGLWPPWRMPMALRGHITHHDGGQLVYDNRYVIFGHLRWGKLADYEVYEDTQKSAAFDRYLTEKEAGAASPM